MPPEEEFNGINVIMQRFESLEILIARRIRLSEHIDHMKRDKVVSTLKLPIQRYREFLEKKLQELVDKIEERHASALSAQAASQAAQAEIAAASAVRTAVAAVIQQCPVCLSEVQDPHLTDCGHVACLACFLAAGIPRVSYPGVPCFICRGNVTSLKKIILPALYYP